MKTTRIHLCIVAVSFQPITSLFTYHLQPSPLMGTTAWRCLWTRALWSCPAPDLGKRMARSTSAPRFYPVKTTLLSEYCLKGNLSINDVGLFTTARLTGHVHSFLYILLLNLMLPAFIFSASPHLCVPFKSPGPPSSLEYSSVLTLPFIIVPQRDRPSVQVPCGLYEGSCQLGGEGLRQWKQSK